MKITCLDKEIGKLLGEAFYRIPRFQRPYSWDHANLEEFWNDTIVDNDSDYFIGNFVFYQDNDTLGVVDGQQRLTTITILLCAIRDVMQEQGFPDLAKGVHSLIERPNIRNERYYVLRPETSYPFFQERIQKFGKRPKTLEAGPEEKLLKEAHEFLRANLDQVVTSIKTQANLSEPKRKTRICEELSKIRDKVLGLKVICTSLDNDDDASPATARKQSIGTNPNRKRIPIFHSTPQSSRPSLATSHLPLATALLIYGSAIRNPRKSLKT